MNQVERAIRQQAGLLSPTGNHRAGLDRGAVAAGCRQLRTSIGPTLQQRRAGPVAQYCLRMSDEQGGPAVGPTLAEWRKAREETERHLATAPVDADWVQRLADLLTTERSWQDQYTELLALGTGDGQFPSSNR